MNRCPKLLLTTALVFAASALLAQEMNVEHGPELMVRLSYDNSGVRERGDFSHICIAVFRDGEYRIENPIDYGMERLHGTMSKEQLSQLSKLLEASDFRNLSGYHAGIIRQDAETFAAEIPAHDPLQPAWRLRMLNADGASPFPAPVAKIADWLKAFQPKDAKKSDDSEFSGTCPSVGVSLVQPPVAENSQP